MSVRSDIFARSWVSAKLVAVAAAAGIGLDELADAVGDPWDYIEDAYLNVHHPK